MSATERDRGLRERRSAGSASSLFERGLTFGSAGNISVRLDDGWLMTPTNVSLGRLDPARLARLDAAGRLIAGDPPTKESFLHRAMYEERARPHAVVHLHSTHSVAVSALADVDPDDVLPPITAYYVMRVGRAAAGALFSAGRPEPRRGGRRSRGKHHAVLLANHGPVVAGSSLDAAANAIEELEETAKLFLMLRGSKLRLLTPEQVAALQAFLTRQKDRPMPKLRRQSQHDVQGGAVPRPLRGRRGRGFAGVEFLFPYDFRADDIAAAPRAAWPHAGAVQPAAGRLGQGRARHGGAARPRERIHGQRGAGARLRARRRNVRASM